MSDTTRAAGTMIPDILKILRQIDRDGDKITGRAVLRNFGLQQAARHGKRAVQVAFAVAKVRNARARRAAEECGRIQALLNEEGGDV